MLRKAGYLVDTVRMAGVMLGDVGRNGVALPDRRIVGLVAACALFAACVLPAVAQKDDLTPEQEAVARSAEQQLIAPCCFRQSLAEHRSELADAMRRELRLMVAEGATEKDVVDHFVAKYGERILVAPRPRGFNLVAYVMPALGLAGGLVLILLFLRRSRKPAARESVPIQAKGSAAAGYDDRLEAQLTEELDRFDR